ncbi:acyltransferase family protein [Rhodococcoides corynebacterioides]|uniref:acyltransferase family protein n=1 Tax=Rhodococcoides corynebacterioides TaxID=53972 RepID=UPI001C9B60FA|nr:acyltransferase [Rhodococcus corynebacterioides]MBY6349112.1 acyltransferase [Rhodococcus corynebacterioides]
MTLGEYFDIRSNSLNSQRLLFATIVIVSHSWPVAGVPGEPTLGDMNYGEISVAGFFAISGYLITGSRLSNSLVPYFRARVLRIFPGFWICLAVSAFIAAPITAAIRGMDSWNVASAFGYLYNNFTLVIQQWGIAATLNGMPRTEWNGPIWTLMYEFACYVLVALVLSVPFFRNRWAVLSVFVFFTGACAGNLTLHSSGFYINAKIENMIEFGAFFFAGAVVFMFRSQLPASPVLAFFAAVTSAAAIWLNLGNVVAPIAVAYLCIWTSARFPRLLVERIGDGTIDISYGMYVYGWMVQQLVVVLGLNDAGIGVMICASVLGTVPIAVASWFLVEKQALRFKKTRRPIDVDLNTALLSRRGTRSAGWRLLG